MSVRNKEKRSLLKFLGMAEREELVFVHANWRRFWGAADTPLCTETNRAQVLPPADLAVQEGE